MPYPFDQILAADPNNPEMVAANARVTVFAPGDTAKTPLTLTTLTGMPLANPITVNDRGFGPAFVADMDQVAWEGGGFTGLLVSYQGLKDEAVEARQAAEVAAQEAQAPTDASVDRGIQRANLPARVEEAISNGPVMAGVVAGYVNTPGNPVHAAIEARVAARKVPELRSLRGAAVPDVLGGYLFVTDSASGRRRQVTSGAQTLTGEPESLGEGVAATIDGARKWISPSGYPRPVATDFTRASGWGSSTMQRLGPDLASMFGSHGTTYHHIAGSVGGFQISHIAAAVGVRPVVAKAFTIPAGTDPVTILPTNMTEANNSAINVAWLGEFAGTGIAGNLQSFPGSNVWTFTRNTPGSAKVVPAGTPYKPSRAAEYQAGVTILNPGKNTLTALTSDWTVDRVIELTDEMYDFFSGAGRQVLILGHFVDTNKPKDSTTRAPIEQFNEHMRTRYGGRFLDVAAYLTGDQVWLDTSIAPSSADREQQALGNKPPSLSADDQHLNQIGDEALTRLIEAKLDSLGWLNTPLPPPPLTTIADDFNRPDGALGLTSVGGQAWKPTIGSNVMAQISNQRMSNPESAVRRSVVTPPSGAQDYEVSARIASIGTSPADKNMSIITRATSYDRYVYLAVRSHSGAEGASIWKQVGTTPVQIGSSNTSVTSSAGQVWKLRVQGSTLTAYVDGTQVLSVTDPDIPQSGDAGLLLGGGSSSGCSWDDFSITKLL